VTGEEEGAPLGEAESAEGAVIAEGACPYLGMVGDPNAHHSFPSRLHLCHAGEPAHIGLGFQADYCLGGLYPSCARYQRAEEAAAAGRPVVAAGAGAAGAVAAEPTLAGAALATAPAADATAPVPAGPPVPAASSSFGRVSGTREPGRRTSPVVSVLLGLALLATIFAFAAAAGLIKLPSGGPVAVVTTPPGSASQTPAASVSPSASASVAPTGSPAPATSAPPSATPSRQPTTATGEIMHTVSAGETLFGIGLQYNVPWLEIATRNGLVDPYIIHVGDVLIIPVAGTPSASPGESPSATSFIYVVKPGDSLSSIASQFQVTQQAILDANPSVTDPNKIIAGQQLVIPAAAP
jgi:LysM repeat protein